MADEQEMKDSADVPAEVTTGATVEDINAEYGKYRKMVADNKGLAMEFGEPDFESLLNKVGSDGGFARALVMHLITGSDKPVGHVLPDAPQENNVTGKLDHTGDVAKRIVTPSTVPAAAGKQDPAPNAVDPSGGSVGA